MREMLWSLFPVCVGWVLAYGGSLLDWANFHWYSLPAIFTLIVVVGGSIFISIGKLLD